MSALPKERIAGIVSAYRDNPSATLATIAAAEGLTEATVRKHIESAGVPIRPEFNPSDDDLGIGDPVVDFTQTQGFKDAVEAAVAAAMAKMAPAMHQNAPVAENGAANADWQKFMRQLETMTQSMQEQKPGYQKPLTASELSSRKQGEAEFFRLISAAKDAVREHGKNKAAALGLIPEYIVGEGLFYGNTNAGEHLFTAGQRLYLTVAPPEDFLPMNDAADAIMRAQLQWHGERTPEIGELVAQAMLRANGTDSIHVYGSEDPEHADEATLIDTAEVVDMRPTRTLGTSVSEVRGPLNGPLSPGATKAPAGPIFVS